MGFDGMTQSNWKPEPFAYKTFYDNIRRFQDYLEYNWIEELCKDIEAKTYNGEKEE